MSRGGHALLSVLFLTPAIAQPPSEVESNSYTVNWPSGLSLGEGKLTAGRSGAKGAEQWKYELALDASVPGFRVSDHFRSTATAELCSTEFEKDFAHGSRKNKETTTFDGKGSATRQTANGGGKSEFSVSPCARDALTFLFFLRRELGQGRLPPAQTIYYGAPYRIRLEYGGSHMVKVGEERKSADRIVASVKGPSSDITFEMFFARDAARTLLMTRVPLALGTFSLEIVR